MIGMATEKKPAPKPRHAAPDLGQVAFEAYAKAIDVEGTGARLDWDARVIATPHVADAWRAVAAAVVAAAAE